VAVWYAKNFYDFWRPFHAIRLGEADGNPLTEADPNWLSEHIVPPLQEYPSAHAIQCQAIARTLRSILGTDHVSFGTESTTALPSNAVRWFDRLRTTSMERRESHIMAGFHYRLSVKCRPAWATESPGGLQTPSCFDVPRPAEAGRYVRPGPG
jgi:hypothetical protein